MTRAEASAVIPHLRREQANAVELYFQYKGYHWNVAGPLFRELHLMFDEHAEKVFGMIDELAERQRMLGARAGYTLEETRATSALRVDRELPATPREMLLKLIASHRVILEGLHEGVRAAEAAFDPGTADLLTGFIEAHQKMEWFLRESAYEPAGAGEETVGHHGLSGEKAELGHAAPWSHPTPAVPERTPH